MKKKPKLLIAVGGTGGHLFPAQTLARDLLSQDSEIELLFAGAGLSTNRYFHKEQFVYQDVSSATPFRGNIFSAAKQILRGVKTGLKLLDEFHPDLLIGFGSFHSASLLTAAVLKKTPFLLFESNAQPGKVNRLFSRWAQMTAVQFSHAGLLLKGETKEVAIPMKCTLIPKGEACHYFGLLPDAPIILVFGGSQGATSINRTFLEAVKLLPAHFQILHFTGHKEDVEQVRRDYAQQGRRACVKEFEEKMAYAYSAAESAVCRAGAVTVAELIAYELPAILIPYPFAT
ncbi:MAG: UDP-N-acetylglucosamine--N-acetylmuramyl-(pentapeptide) pyrophosphoryl-undecaprenol N-acetylglucosamine transferase, partial [Chlamydiales bacterium]